MKKIWIIVALAGLTAASSCEQNNEENMKATAGTQKTHMVPRTPVANTDPTCFLGRKDRQGYMNCNDVAYKNSTAYGGNYPKQSAGLPAHRARAMEKMPVTHTGVKPAPTAEEEAFFHYTPSVNTPVRPCYTYRQNNIVVKECPDDFYSNKYPLMAAPVEYQADNAYMGYYPDDTKNTDPCAMENREVQMPYIPNNDLSGSNDIVDGKR